MEIGTRLRDLRIAKRITLKELSQTSGLTVSFLSQLERNLISPSVKSLRKIAQSLGIKVAYFFEEDEVKDFVFIRNALQTHFEEKIKTFRQAFISDLLNIKMAPSLLRLKENGRFTERTHQKGEEFGIVRKGLIGLLRNEQKFILKKNDFIYFISIKPKTFTNIGKGTALILWTQLRES